jgi:hypothetical protein
MGQPTMHHLQFLGALVEETQVTMKLMKIDFAMLTAGSSSTSQLLFI